MDIQFIKGVGPKRAKKLNRLGIYSVEDLLRYYPKDYEDRSKFSLLKRSPIGEKVSLKIKIITGTRILRPRRNMSILKVPFEDSSGVGYLTFFNQEYLRSRFKVGEEYRIYGKLKRVGAEYQISNPTYEKRSSKNKTGRIIPKYGLTKGLSNNQVIKIIRTSLNDHIRELDESIPGYLIDKYGMMGIREAIKTVHFPKDFDSLTRARNRLKFEELFSLQLGLFMMKEINKSVDQGISFSNSENINGFIKELSFNLTGAQSRVVEEIEEDMNSLEEMNRLVQGDVGSGKTVVAAIAMYKSVTSGYQAAMLAPTEILAMQHFESLKELFSKFDIKCGILVGSLKAKEKEEILEKIKSGEIDIIIGTHAIIQEGIEFNKLGLAITDEQHRFGVKQRAILNKKGNNPDVLVMTATPIPRTLALILYGDLDISIIDELPPGRKEIETFAVGENMVDRANDFIRKQLLEGRQAYVVCPVIEESEISELNSVEDIYINLKEEVFQEFNVGLLHGKMKSDEKDKIMESFKEGLIDILVSTTVIEVGVDVPNSNIMCIYNSERFGLAQLHQLRGRVGRGEYQSYCILINYSSGKVARKRMQILEQSSDGFIISEKDLELRGPGEFFGTRQHGLPELKIANLFIDMKMLKMVQKEAIKIIEEDPGLNKKMHERIREKIEELFKEVNKDLILN